MTHIFDNAKNYNKRLRYQTDPSYRESILENNKKYRDAKKEPQKKISIPRGWRVIEKKDDVTGITEQYYTIGYLASIIDCSPQTLRSWDKDGTLPAPDYKDDQGLRYYRLSTINNIKTLIGSTNVFNDSQPYNIETDGTCYLILDMTNNTTAEIMLYKFSALVHVSGKRRITLDKLIADGCIPQTPFRVGTKEHRLYTKDMMVSIKEAFTFFKTIKKDQDRWNKFKSFIQERWNNLGIQNLKILSRIN